MCYSIACVWRSVGNFRASVLYFHMGSKDGTQGFRLGSPMPLPAEPSCWPSPVCFSPTHLVLSDRIHLYQRPCPGSLCGVGLSSGYAVCSTEPPAPQLPSWTSLGSGTGHEALQLMCLPPPGWEQGGQTASISLVYSSVPALSSLLQRSMPFPQQDGVGASRVNNVNG